MGYPVTIQHLINGHSSLQDCRLLKDYAIKTDMTITLNLQLRGGTVNQSTSRSAGGDKGKKSNSQQQTNGGSSYKNILQGKTAVGTPPIQDGNALRPYIVE